MSACFLYSKYVLSIDLSRLLNSSFFVCFVALRLYSGRLNRLANSRSSCRVSSLLTN